MLLPIMPPTRKTITELKVSGLREFIWMLRAALIDLSGGSYMGKLQNRVALVTGGARGVGEATVRRFVREGASVVIADVRDELGTRVADELGELAHYIHLDVTSESDWMRAVNVTVDRFGKL